MVRHDCCLRVFSTLTQGAILTITRILYSEFYSLDHNVEETAIAAYWITDGIDRCCVGFLPRHCVHCANQQFDCHIVQVVALLALSENALERKHSRNNRDVCCACIIDSKMTSVVANLNEPPQRQEAAAARIHALASSILAGGSDSDKDTDE